ncbi:MAG: HAMP domain-containing protein, partial [Gammaproteobacteria bacterium]
VQRLEQTLAKMDEQNRAALDEFDGPLYKSIDPISGKITELVNLQLEEAKREHDRNEGRYTQIRAWFISGTALVLLLVLSAGYWVSSSLSHSINIMRDTIGRVERDSDLSLRVAVHSGDELGQTAAAFNKMLEKIQGIIGEVTGATAQLASAAEEMSAITEQTSTGVR